MFLDNYDGTSLSCGTSLPSIFTKFEFDCSAKKGYQVTIKSINISPSFLQICSVGILSTCDCTQTSFLYEDLMDLGPKTGSVTVNAKGYPVYLNLKTGDAVSYVCGSAGNGLDYCGSRTIKFYSMPSDVYVTTATYPFFSFDPNSNQITLNPTSVAEVGIY